MPPRNSGYGTEHQSSSHRQFDRECSESEESAHAAGDSGKRLEYNGPRLRYLDPALKQRHVEGFSQRSVYGTLNLKVNQPRQAIENPRNWLARYLRQASYKALFLEYRHGLPEDFLILQRKLHFTILAWK